MRPTLRLLEDALVGKILDEARTLLSELGVEIHNREALALLGDHGATVDLAAMHATISGDLVDRAIASAAKSFRLYDPVRKE